MIPPPENNKLIPEREKQPIYGCITFPCKEDELKSVYEAVLDELTSGRRKSEFRYMWSVAIFSDDITDSEKKATLEILRKVFLTNGEIEFESCYIDMLGNDTVNCGMYFANNSQLEKLKTAFGNDLKISFIADVDVNGRYVNRATKEQYGHGHFTNIPHLSKFKKK